MGVSAKIIADSISPDGIRLTTMEVTFHRFVLAEFNTHRAFSRNSASSRAIPVNKQIRKIQEELAYPVEFGTNQPGMQAGPPLLVPELTYAEEHWEDASKHAISQAEVLGERYEVHKQVTNRLLEPFMWHTVIVTSVDYQNFFNQRCSPLAQPEIRAVAEKMKEAYDLSVPEPIGYHQWHLPYIQPDEFDLTTETLIKVSAARCARVSYLTHDGTREIEKDLDLFEKLVSAEPPHWSPLEHVATPYVDEKYWEQGNFIEFERDIKWVEALAGTGGDYQFTYHPRGWAQLRHNLEIAFDA